jgi:uncharacterized membrane protein
MIVRGPLFLLLLLLLPALVLLWRWRGARVGAAVLALRLVIAGLLVLALANPVLGQPAPAPGALAILLDQSDSLGEAGKAALRSQAEALARAHGADAHILPFGAAPQADPAAPLRADGTDIAAALAAARGLLNGGGRVVLLSDGAQTRGDALGAARALGVPVDTLAYAPAAPPELWVASVEAPATLRVGEEFSITVVVGSSGAASAQLELFEGERQLATQNVSLEPGANRFTYQDRAETAGVARFRALVNGQPDTFAQNNSGAATALIAPQPRVLLLESQTGSGGDQLGRALRNAGVLAEVLPAGDLPAQLSALDPFEGIVLLDVPAGDFTLDQMATLREFVRSEGRGLVVAGGRASFTLGAYKDTPLEEALPVSMDPPPRPERPPVTLLLILDHSLSMGTSSGVSKLDMAKESALLATDSLRQDDRIGVLAFDDTQMWAVEFQVLGTGLSLGQIQEQIGAIQLGGGTDICAALDRGLSALEQQPGSVRHAVIMTDGQSFRNDRCGPYQSLIDRARAADITLSSIAIGDDADTDLLQNLARWGAGRYHFAAQPSDIPRLTLIESQIASAEPQIEGEFRVQLQAPHPLLRDFAPNQIPRLEGYVGTTIKPGAELVLKSPENDPVLATWQYGLGRAVAWTPSANAPWAADWPSWPDYGRFWAQIVRYTLPEPDTGPLQVRATPRGDSVTLAVDALAPSGEPIDLADTAATVTLPDGSTRRIALRQTAPGHYVEELTLPGEGPYAIAVTQQKDGTTRTAATGYVQAPPAEYTPAQGGAALLAQISAATGGNVLNGPDTVPAAGTPASAPAPRELWPWLLAAAAILWPLEIAMRRGWLRFGR